MHAAPGREVQMIRIDSDKCTACGRCAEICPVGALKLGAKARLDTTRCVKCRLCLTVCPVKAIRDR